MEQAFNTKHGAVTRNYQPQDKIYLREFRNPNKVNWKPAFVLERRGKVMYVVETLDNDVWRRHTNQICPREDSNTENSNVTLPVQMLFEEYNISKPDFVPPTSSAIAS